MSREKNQTRAVDDCINQMVQRIVETAAPERIILFGSHANGTAKLDSDIDLMVIESASFGPSHSRRKEMARLWMALKQFALPKDILVYSHDEWEQWRNASNHIIALASREGRILYERA